MEFVHNFCRSSASIPFIGFPSLLDFFQLVCGVHRIILELFCIYHRLVGVIPESNLFHPSLRNPYTILKLSVLNTNYKSSTNTLNWNYTLYYCLSVSILSLFRYSNPLYYLLGRYNYFAFMRSIEHIESFLEAMRWTFDIRLSDFNHHT